tara:strand:+ start:12661 stop:13227 length:567 start_codon:yes stop_codon:yes gene_type:complete
MQINMQALISDKIAKTRVRSSTTRVFNGRLTSPLSPMSFHSMKINKLGINLAKNGNLKIEAHSDNNKVAQDILTTLGCSQVLDPKINIPDFSLLTQQTDSEIVLNPNKIDMGIFKNIGKGKIYIKNVMKDEANYFYRLDQDIPKNYAREQEKIKEENPYEYDIVVSKLYDINFLNPYTPALRSLRNNR